MVSAIYLSQKLGMDIEHLWIGEPYRCASDNIQLIHNKSFGYFFEEKLKRCDYRTMKDKVNKVYTEWMPNMNPNSWYNFQSYGQKLLEISKYTGLELVNEKMDTSENFLIETSYINNLKITKDDKTKIYKQYFIPRDIFMQEINKITDFNEAIIGIAIRKGDFIIHNPELQIDDNMISKWVDSIESKIFFCSDDEKYEKEMRNKYKNAVIPKFSNSVNKSDIFFLDLILLSKCVKIYGIQKSSFAEEAANFGGVEYIPLTKEFIKLHNELYKYC